MSHSRKQWEELSAKRHSFLVGSQVGEVQTVALRRANTLHDVLVSHQRKVLAQASLHGCSCICFVDRFHLQAPRTPKREADDVESVPDPLPRCVIHLAREICDSFTHGLSMF